MEIKLARGYVIGKVVKALEQGLGEKLNFKKAETNYVFRKSSLWQKPSLHLPRREIYETRNGTIITILSPERKNIVEKVKIDSPSNLDIYRSYKKLESIGAISNA
ncbi:hypothetical protein K9L16_03405 [Candidatus Pacearchaeota archaeon]|nr:hypothetical protein [Candidatus Pacearchaeota archaeon]